MTDIITWHCIRLYKRKVEPIIEMDSCLDFKQHKRNCLTDSMIIIFNIPRLLLKVMFCLVNMLDR